MPETAWAVRTLRRWRRGWAGLYLLLSVMGALFSTIPLSVFAEQTGWTLWHWPMIVGGPIAIIGLRVRRPFVELSGVVGCLLTLLAYLVVVSIVAWGADEGQAGSIGFVLLVSLPIYMLIYRIVDVWTFPRLRRRR